MSLVAVAAPLHRLGNHVGGPKESVVLEKQNFLEVHWCQALPGESKNMFGAAE